MRKELRIAVVSSESEFLNKENNIKHFEELVKDAKSQDARLVCFPELSIPGYSLSEEAMNLAEPVPGPSSDACAEIAKKHNVYISLGIIESSEGKYYITQFIVGPEGFVGKYRKHFLAMPETGYGLVAGEEKLEIFMIDEFRVAISICYDSHFPSLVKELKDEKVELILYPHGNVRWLGKDAEEWTRLRLTRAVPNAISARAYVAINNSAGNMQSEPNETQFGSGAMVIDPLGQVVKRTMQNDCIEKMIVCDLKMPLTEHLSKYVVEGMIQRENFCCDASAGNFNKKSDKM